MTAVYSICVRFTVDDGRAHHERRRADRRGAFSIERNFLATRIRYRHEFSVLGCTRESLLATVLLPFLAETPFVPCTGHPMTRCAATLPALVAAVPLPAIVPSADHEHLDAPAARQLVNRNARVQGSGCDRQKFGSSPGPWDEWFVERPALGLRPKARARDSGLHSFRCALIIPANAIAGPVLHHGPLVTGDPGGSGPPRDRW
jgi:hypothetical protein